MATKAPKHHNVDIEPGQKLNPDEEKRIIAYGNRVSTDQGNFITLCDEVISKERCEGCPLAGGPCMSSMAERR